MRQHHKLVVLLPALLARSHIHVARFSDDKIDFLNKMFCILNMKLVLVQPAGARPVHTLPRPWPPAAAPPPARLLWRPRPRPRHHQEAAAEAAAAPHQLLAVRVAAAGAGRGRAALDLVSPRPGSRRHLEHGGDGGRGRVQRRARGLRARHLGPAPPAARPAAARAPAHRRVGRHADQAGAGGLGTVPRAQAGAGTRVAVSRGACAGCSTSPCRTAGTPTPTASCWCGT